MNKPLKSVPDFKSEDEEREFWGTHDTTDFVDWSKAHHPPPFPNLKRSEDLLTFKIPESEVENLSILAKKHHVTRDALARKYVLEGIRREQTQARP